MAHIPRNLTWLFVPGLMAALTLVLIGAGGCAGVGVAQVGEMKTMNLDIDYPAAIGPAELTLGFGAANLSADARGSNLLQGTVRYNVIGLTPEIIRRGERIEIKQTSNVSPVGMTNDWELHFGKERPFRLKINAGAYDGDWDLGGVPLQELEVNQGASRSTFDFSAPNPEVMSRLQFRTGAASLELRNLANAGFQRMSFEGAASSYTLDFGGRLMRDAEAKVTAGVSDLTIIVPADTQVQIIMKESLTGLQADEEFIRAGSAYRTPAWNSTTGPRLTIEVQMGLGNVTLRMSPARGSTV